MIGVFIIEHNSGSACVTPGKIMIGIKRYVPSFPGPLSSEHTGNDCILLKG